MAIEEQPSPGPANWTTLTARRSASRSPPSPRESGDRPLRGAAALHCSAVLDSPERTIAITTKDIRMTWTREAIAALGPTTDVPTTASILGMGEWTIYESIRRDEWTITRVLRLGNKIKIPVADLLTLLYAAPTREATAPTGGSPNPDAVRAAADMILAGVRTLEALLSTDRPGSATGPSVATAIAPKS